MGFAVHRARPGRGGIADPAAAGLRRRSTPVGMPKRVAAIDVSHWHSAYDAAYLRILCDLGCRPRRGLRPRRADRQGPRRALRRHALHRLSSDDRGEEAGIRHRLGPALRDAGDLSDGFDVDHHTTYSIRVRLLTH